MSDERWKTHVVVDAENGLRLDRWLRRQLPGEGLGAIFRMLRKRVVRVDGKKAEPSLRLAPGMEIRLPAAAGESATAPPPRRSALHLDVLHQDDHLIAVHKPAGVPVHGGSGHADHVELWVRTVVVPTLPQSGSEHFRPAPAHRLDAVTSGVLLIGTSPEGQRGLAALFRRDQLEKTYLGWVADGAPNGPDGTIRAPLARVEARRGDRPKVVVDEGGRMCRTDWRVVDRSAGEALLEVRLHGGFMHQIRAHLAHAGMPLVGDTRYGGGAGELRLHAWRVAFDHPVTGARVEVEAAPPWNRQS